MATARDKSNKMQQAEMTAQDGAKAGKPEWADGLRQLYDAVVEEPLPDTFKDLLAQLDRKN